MLKAVGSGIRLQVLTLLYDKGSLSYTEIMTNLKLNQSKDAGKFAYHLKFLLRTDLIEPDLETRKYRLTDLGKMIVDIAEEIERHTFKRKKTMVRTSRLAMEEFDRNKIALSLIKEANVPVSQAQKIAREAEKRLQAFKTKYLTAPLIREIVNTILLEKGLEDYRHKLTRLGVPVYDVSQLIKNTANTNAPSVETVHRKTGDAVIEEYTLLSVLPREVADAHVSGAINLDNLGTWILKPNEIMHDLRCFMKNGNHNGNASSASGLRRPPKNLDQLLAFILNVLRWTSGEISGEQTIDYFNLFLAPFTKDVPLEEVKEKLRLLIDSLTQETQITATLGLELVVPDFLKEKETIGPEGNTNGPYKDFENESRRLALTLLELILEESKEKPVFNPSIVIKLRPEALNNSECQPILLRAHQLAGLLGTPYFANMATEKQGFGSYAATGSRLGVEWKGDWELDTLQTGNIDDVAINLPRIAYLSEGKEAKFSQILDEQLEIATQALEIKHHIIKQRLDEGLLPFLHQKMGENGGYFRRENATRTISLCGLYEAVHSLLGKSLQTDPEALKFAEEILKSTNTFAKEHSRKPENRTVCSLVSSAEASKRFAELDAERFGWATINAQGSKEQPFYTNVGIMPRSQETSWQDRFPFEENFHKLAQGGNVTLLPLTEAPVTLEELLSTTKQVANTRNIGLFAYDRVLTYCTNCKHIAYTIMAKCQSCGEANTLIAYSRSSAKYSST